MGAGPEADPSPRPHSRRIGAFLLRRIEIRIDSHPGPRVPRNAHPKLRGQALGSGGTEGARNGPRCGADPPT